MTPEEAVRPGPVREGLFVAGEPPRLVAGRCGSCRRLHFPAGDDCPYCGAGNVERTEVDGRGRLWAWTAVTAPPPGYSGEVPFGFGVVELDAGMRVVTRLTESDPTVLRADQAMRLEVVPLHQVPETPDDAGGAGSWVTTYAFAPDTTR